MQPIYTLSLIVAYFAVLLLISYYTGRDDSNASFFKAKNKAPWYLVAFGMVGASLSGVSFISVPGWVASSQFSYMQVVLGFSVGYVVIAYVLLPIYYRLNVTSVYQYLEERFGEMSYKTGALFFFISRMVGAAFQLFLVAKILQYFVFDAWNIPFFVTVIVAVLLIWLYTNRGGIKTIVWTDALQTLFMLLALVIALFSIINALDWDWSMLRTSEALAPYTRMIFTDDFLAKEYFWKSFIGGVFITVAMTGLDQDMMQKNLACRNLKEARKNMLSYGVVFIPVNLLFLTLGALLYVYAHKTGVNTPQSADLLFPEVVMQGDLGVALPIVFLLGLIAAAYSSADSALTALTTSFCIDFLAIEKKDEEDQKRTRKKVHVGISALLIGVIVVFNYLFNQSVIDLLLLATTYTYGPLLGLFAFGIFTKKQVHDKYVLFIALVAVILTAVLGNVPAAFLGGYHFNYELLVVNGTFTFIGLILIRRK